MASYCDFLLWETKTAYHSKSCIDDMKITRPIASENRCKLYQPERKLTKPIQTSLNLEGEAQGEIRPYQKILSP